MLTTANEPISIMSVNNPLQLTDSPHGLHVPVSFFCI